MKKTPTSDKDDEFALFRETFRDVAPIKQDKIPPTPPRSKEKSASKEKNRKAATETRQASASFHFSDGFEAHFSSQGPLKYVKPGTDTHEVKRLRRGEYPPDLILDLHGLTRDQAKSEIAALIFTAQKEHLPCVCIVHGIGGHILKKSVPSWLVQHPGVLCFHQAPLEWGGQGAVLALIDVSH